MKKLKNLYSQLFPFQKEIVDKYKDRTRLGLFLDMGLGKTITSLALCEANDINRIIFIGLKSKTSETVSDKGSFDYYLNEMGFNIHKIDKLKNNELPELVNEKEALIINYERLLEKRRSNELNSALSSFIKQSKGKKIAVIVDESHKVKSSSTKNSKMLEKVNSLINVYGYLYLYLLTGTPWTKDYMDFHNQLKFLGMPLSFSKFKEKFAVLGHIKGILNWQQPVIGFKNLDELFNLVSQYSISEMTENNIELPNQVFIEIKLPKTKIFDTFLSSRITEKEHAKLFKERGLDVEETTSLKLTPNMFFRNLSFPKMDWFADTPSKFWMRSRQLSIGFQGNEENFEWFDESRVEKLKELLDEKRDNYIIFYNYTPEFFKIFEVCESLGYKVDVYNGNIKNLTFYDEFEKMNEEQRFNAPRRVIVTNYASGGIGKNWQLYHKTIFFSIGLYGLYSQALKRNHRIGQSKPIHYYTFYQDNFLDKGMLQALEEKVEYNYEMFNYQLEKVKNN